MPLQRSCKPCGSTAPRFIDHSTKVIETRTFLYCLSRSNCCIITPRITANGFKGHKASMPTAHGQHASASSQSGNGFDNLIVRSESLKRVMKLAEKVARHPAAVLIVGETGTGKEMI